MKESKRPSKATRTVKGILVFDEDRVYIYLLAGITWDVAALTNAWAAFVAFAGIVVSAYALVRLLFWRRLLVGIQPQMLVWYRLAAAGILAASIAILLWRWHAVAHSLQAINDWANKFVGE